MNRFRRISQIFSRAPHHLCASFLTSTRITPWYSASTSKRKSISFGLARSVFREMKILTGAAHLVLTLLKVKIHVVPSHFDLITFLHHPITQRTQLWNNKENFDSKQPIPSPRPSANQPSRHGKESYRPYILELPNCPHCSQENLFVTHTYLDLPPASLPCPTSVTSFIPTLKLYNKTPHDKFL